MSRFIKIPNFFYLEEDLYFGHLYINPFQIESFQEAKLEYVDEEGNDALQDAVTIITKSGAEHGLLIHISEFMELVA